MSKKEIIKKFIIDSLKENLSITRPEISSSLQTRPATIFSIVDELKETDLLIEPERTGKNLGSKASPISLNPSFTHLLGIDFKINYTVGVITDFQGKILFKAKTQSTPGKRILEGKQEIETIIQDLINQSKNSNIPISGIGFADPGIVDQENEISIQAVNISGWQNLETGKWLRETFNLKHSHITPAPMARAYAEFHHLHEKPKSLYQLSLGVGIGSGFIKNNTLFQGDTNCAMEIGHIVVQPDGPLCKCGNYGCLEAIAGMDAIQQNIKKIVESGVHTSLDANNFSISQFIECVTQGDKAAYTLANDICEKIAISLTSIVAILNPTKIIISGELSALNEILLSTVKRNLALRCFPRALENLSIEVSKLDQYSTAQGAALLTRNKILKNLQKNS